MRTVCLARFIDWTANFESDTDFPYDDIEGLVTIGPGLLCSRGLLLSLPCVHPDGTPATHEEIQAAYDFLQSPAALATDKQGGAHYALLTNVRVTREGLALAAKGTLLRFESQLRASFRGWDDACADAQLPVLSKAWAGGGLFAAEWPRFTAAWNASEWEECAAQAMPSPAKMAAQNESYRRRIAAEQRHLRAAAMTPDPESFSIWP
jgi:hypothetical protein